MQTESSFSIDKSELVHVDVVPPSNMQFPDGYSKELKF